MQPPLTPILTPEDLATAWNLIDGGFGYSAPQIFILIIEADGTVSPTIIQIYDAEVGGEPDGALLSTLMERLARVLELNAPGGSVAFLKARPGPPTLTCLDLRWLQGLHHHLRIAAFASHQLFFASDTGAAPVPPDALV